MQKLGTNYGGWIIPNYIKLNDESIVYSAGVGEDISFDILLQTKYNSNIFLIDPTKRSVTHYDECKKFYNTGSWSFSGDIQKDYKNIIFNLTPNFDKLFYINKGLWKKKDTLKFYKQNNQQYVSQSLMDNMFGNNYDEVPVDSIKNIMLENSHSHIDLLKIDIEGAENIVLNQMLDDNIYPTYLCIEFDLLMKNKDTNNSTKKIIKRLFDNGYKLLANDNLNITFVRLNDLQNNCVEIGKVNWKHEDIYNYFDEFIELYNKRPIKENSGGMNSVHCFALYFFLKQLNLPYIIESGVWKGQSTWLIENTCPDSKLTCIDINLNFLVYKSKKATYHLKDWKLLNFENTPQTLCFFDDHQNAPDRIKHAVKNNYKYLIFEDNYPRGHGDCISLKQVLESNTKESKFLKKYIKTYYEFPPVFKNNKTRWKTNWDQINYPTKPPLFDTLTDNKYKLFKDDTNGYTWIAFVELY